MKSEITVLRPEIDEWSKPRLVLSKDGEIIVLTDGSYRNETFWGIVVWSKGAYVAYKRSHDFVKSDFTSAPTGFQVTLTQD